MNKRIGLTTKEKAQKLREKGYSITQISSHCEISKTTALRYTQNILILPRYRKKWEERKNGAKILSERQKNIAQEKAQAMIKTVDASILAAIAASLYWAEGSKKDFSFFNSNPEMVKLFLYILRNVFAVENENLKISLRIYEDLDKNKCLKFWSKITGIKLTTQTSINLLKGKKKGKLLYGMCRIRVKKGGLLLKEFSAIINRVVQLTAKPL